MGSCCYETYDTPVFNEEYRRAAKDYACCECGGDIKKGDTYQRIKMLQEGNWYDYITCEPCADLRDALGEVDCPYYEGLSECYSNYISEEGFIGRIKPGTHAARLVPDYYLKED